MLKRLIQGDGIRKSRLHNYHGRLLDAAGFRYVPHSILTALALKVANRRPELPWLGFRAIEHLGKTISSDWKILEFGSGMSTIWFARRCELVASIETDEGWYNTIRAILNEQRIDNVDYRLYRDGCGQILSDYSDSTFDLVLVDGYERDQAMKIAISKVKPGGYVYLDNSDVPYQEHRTARALLTKAARAKSEIKVFNDLYPTQFCVNEGMLVRVFNKTWPSDSST